MTRRRGPWGPEGPPPEAYSRVTDPERFRPLHAFALALLDDLRRSFDVEHVEGYGLDPEQEDRYTRSGRSLARPSVRLVPSASDSAPLTVVFTAFPGLMVRAGHWCDDAFPSCGCDACAETADDESRRLREMVDDVVAGRFRERISLPMIGSAWRSRELWLPQGHRSASRSRIGRERGRAMIDAAGRSAVDWKAWTRRRS